jgi:hypothetical protein
MLEIIDETGHIGTLSPGEAEVFLRFELFSECLLLLQDEGFGWVNALDRYSRLRSANERGVDPTEFTPPVTPFASAVQGFRGRLNKFLESVRRNASTDEMGISIRRVFAGTCGMLIATELEIERRGRSVVG